MYIALWLVIVSGLIHSIWNLFIKKSGNKQVFLWLSQLVSLFLSIPWVLLAWDQIPWNAQTVLYIGLIFVVHGTYMVLLSISYTMGDMSKVYPIMRGISPLVVPIIGAFFLNESLSTGGWLGVALIGIGIFSLSDLAVFRKKRLDNELMVALLVGLCVAGYMVVDKLALEHLTPIHLYFFLNLGSFVALSFYIRDQRLLGIEWKKNRKSIILVGVLMPTSFIVFLYALSYAEVSVLAPMREIGTVFGAIFGVCILKEKQGIRRIMSSVVITIGVMVLGFGS